MFPHIKVAARAGLGAAAAMALLAGCAGTGASDGTGGSDSRYVAGDPGVQLIKDRKTAPQAKGTGLDGTALSLAGYKGKVVVVNFWASWCAPCRGEAPSLAKLAQVKQAQGVQFLGIDIKDAKSAALAFERTFGTPYPSIFDPDGQVTLGFRVVPPSAVPSTLILDRQGRVAVRIIGLTTYSRLSPLIDKVAAEK